MAGSVADRVIDRVLEPEAMDTAEEAREYDLMDHTTVNARFVTDVLEATARLGRRQDLRRRFVVDVGRGRPEFPSSSAACSPQVVSWPSILRVRCCGSRGRMCCPPG